MKNQLLIFVFLLLSGACTKVPNHKIPQNLAGKWSIAKIYLEEITICEPCDEYYIFEPCDEELIYQNCTLKFINNNLDTTFQSVYRLNYAHDSLFINGGPYRIHYFDKNKMTIQMHLSSGFKDLVKVK